MLNLKLKDGSALDIPAESILMVEENPEGKKLTNIVYSLEAGQNLFDTLDAAYGYVKKQWREQNPHLGNLLEVNLAGDKPHKMIFADTMVIARRELKDDPSGANTRLTLNVNGKVVGIQVTDNRDSLAGEA